MNDYCVKLNLDIDPLKPEINVKDYINDYWNFLPFNSLNPKLIKLFLERNVFFSHIALFYSKGYIVHPIHHDYLFLTDMVKINWVYGDNHVMNWYHTEKNKSVNVLNGKSYVAYKPEEVKLIHSEQVQCPSLLQVGIPHNVINYSGDRYCISLGLYFKENKQHIPMHVAQTIFKDLI